MRERGFSLGELMVALAVVAILAAVSAPFLLPASRAAAHSAALDQLVTDLQKHSQRAATTGAAVVYSPAKELIREDQISVNAYEGSLPEGAAIEPEIAFEGGTGRAKNAGAQAVTLTGEDGRVTAAVVGALGQVRVWELVDGEWRPQ